MRRSGRNIPVHMKVDPEYFTKFDDHRKRVNKQLGLNLGHQSFSQFLSRSGMLDRPLPLKKVNMFYNATRKAKQKR